MAVAAAPGIASTDVTVDVTFAYTLVNFETTFALNVQVAPGSSVAPVRPMLPPPANAVIVPPPQDPLSPLGVATARPAGRGSAKEMPVKVTMAFGFKIVKIALTGWFTGTATA